MDREIIHKDTCLFEQLNTQRASNYWIRRWPNHCRECYGLGGFVSPGGLEEADGFDLCDGCIDKEPSSCPRCAKSWTEDINERCKPCPHCGWEWGMDDSDILPFNCRDWMADLYYNEGYCGCYSTPDLIEKGGEVIWER